MITGAICSNIDIMEVPELAPLIVLDAALWAARDALFAAHPELDGHGDAVPFKGPAAYVAHTIINATPALRSQIAAYYRASGKPDRQMALWTDDSESPF